MTVQLEPQAEAALARIVAIGGRSREEVFTEAMQSYADWLQFEQARVYEKRADLAAGRYLSHEEVFSAA